MYLCRKLYRCTIYSFSAIPWVFPRGGGPVAVSTLWLCCCSVSCLPPARAVSFLIPVFSPIYRCNIYSFGFFARVFSKFSARITVTTVLNILTIVLVSAPARSANRLGFPFGWLFARRSSNYCNVISIQLPMRVTLT